MRVAPAWRVAMVEAWLDDLTDLWVAATTDPYDPAAQTAADYTLVGDPAELIAPAVEVVGDQVWVTVDPAEVTLASIPALTAVQALVVYGTGTGPLGDRVVAYLDRRADSTPMAWSADGGPYDVTFPAGFVVRL